MTNTETTPSTEAAIPAAVANTTPSGEPTAKQSRKERRAAAKLAKGDKPAKTGEKASKAAGDGTTDQVRIRRSIVPAKFKQAYSKHNDTCGDKLALVLKKATTRINEDGRETLDVAALAAIAKANGIDFGRYKDLNNGQKRMNVSNKLRGMLKNEEKVTIGTTVFASTKALVKPDAAQAAA